MFGLRYVPSMISNLKPLQWACAFVRAHALLLCRCSTGVCLKRKHTSATFAIADLETWRNMKWWRAQHLCVHTEFYPSFILIKYHWFSASYLKLCMFVDVFSPLSAEDELSFIRHTNKVVLHGVTQQSGGEGKQTSTQWNNVVHNIVFCLDF